MTKITNVRNLNTKALANNILRWFENQHFEVRISNENNHFFIQARKTNAIRVALSADHALIVGIHCEGNGTIIEVKQGSWETKVISNAIWLALTGGTNLLISGWSVILQKDLENFIESYLFKDPVVLDPNHSVPFPRPSKNTQNNYLPEKPFSNAIKSGSSAISKIGRDIKSKTSKLITKMTDKPETKFCRKCGEKIEKPLIFCSYCGQKIK